MAQSPEEPKSLGQAFLLGAVKAAAWALPVVASSLLVLWLQKQLSKGADQEVIVIPRLNVGR